MNTYLSSVNRASQVESMYDAMLLALHHRMPLPNFPLGRFLLSHFCQIWDGYMQNKLPGQVISYSKNLRSIRFCPVSHVTDLCSEKICGTKFKVPFVQLSPWTSQDKLGQTYSKSAHHDQDVSLGCFAKGSIVFYVASSVFGTDSAAIW